MWGVEGLRFFGFGVVAFAARDVVEGAVVERGKGAIALGRREMSGGRGCGC